ncbi:MAG TPA: OmpA family protein [Puia sp.]|nr:OmpA family protein [Puia sp.]
MAFNVVDTVKNLFGDEMVSKAAASLNESETSISKAISGIIPSIIGGIVSKASSGDHGQGTILDLVRSAANSGILNNISSAFDSNSNILSKGWEMLKTIFGDKLNGVVAAVANYAGIKESTSSSLMSMVAPAALASIGQHVEQNHLNSSTLTSWLASEKNKIISAIPNGLGSSLTGLLGLSSIGKTVSATAHHAEEAVEKTGNSMKFLLPVFLAILAIILLIYFFKGCNGADKASTGTDTLQEHVKADTIAVTTPALESIKVKLPNGIELDAYKGGIEDKLVAFLMTDYAKLGEDSLKKIWFDFDNLTFKFGSAEITPESQHQIDNIAAILKAFSKSKIKIGGYTDKTGDEPVNKKLSGDRATAVKAALDKAGVGKQVISAEGYGSDFAVYPANAPESDRVHDRHVSVSVR